MKWKVAVGVVAVCFTYVWLSSPGEVVVDERGRVAGLFNEAREALQGRRFWKDQFKHVQKELAWERGLPARNAKLDQEIRETGAEIERSMQGFYRKYPEERPSRAERRAESLRDKADAIEMAELDRESEAMRKKRITELEAIEKILTAKLQ